MRLVLASASPRRAELLRAAGFSFETMVVDVDEEVRAGESPSDYVRRLAQEKSARALALIASISTPELTASAKATAVRRSVPRRRKLGRTATPVGSDFSRTDSDVIVLGADTAVVVDDVILGKPRDEDDARGMLRRLSGRDHEVLTGISLRTAAVELGSVETTTVWFMPLSVEDVERYVASGEGRDKAGGYAIQGLASRFIPRLVGAYSNVVGLPVARVAELLTEIHQLGKGL